MRRNMVNIGAKNIIFDGADLSSHFDITDAQIQAFPDIEISSTKIPGRPGTHFSEREIGDRSLTLKMSVRGWDRHVIHIYQFWRELAPLLLKSRPAPMKLDEAREINVIAQSSTEIERLGKRGVSEISFIANDPFFYGKTHEIELPAASKAFRVSGGYEVWPTIEITGAEGELVILNEITGDRIRIPSVLSSDAKIVVDMERNRCTINGSYLAVDMSVTDYFSLPLGDAKIKLSQGEGVLRYRERFI